MKRRRRNSSFHILLVLWCVTLFGGLATAGIIHVQNKQVAKLNDQLSIVQQHVLDENWETALALLQASRTSWERLRSLWSFYTEHQELDIVTDHFVDSEAKIKLNESDAYVSLSLAMDRIKTLPERDALMLENLF